MLVLMLACSSPEPFDPAGVWLLQIAASEGSLCETTIEHNFAEAAPPSEEDEDDGSTYAESDTLLAARVARSGDALLMVVEDKLLPLDSESAQATFAWQQWLTASESESHEAGYGFAYTVEQSDTLRVYLDLPSWESDAATVVAGSWEEETSLSEHWEESDTWPDEAEVGATGAMPSGDHLVVTEDSEDTAAPEPVEVPVSNTQTGEECTSSPCQLDALTTCLSYRALTATLTDLDPQEESWLGAGWASGVSAR